MIKNILIFVVFAIVNTYITMRAIFQANTKHNVVTVIVTPTSNIATKTTASVISALSSTSFKTAATSKRLYNCHHFIGNDDDSHVNYNTIHQLRNNLIHDHVDDGSLDEQKTYKSNHQVVCTFNIAINDTTMKKQYNIKQLM
jgi:hypothetical protein